MEGLASKGSEGEMIARPSLPWFRLLKVLQVQEGCRDVPFLCLSRLVMLIIGGGEKGLIIVIVTVPAA
jgi:hypothetical protein